MEPGCPSKRTPERRKKILDLLREGNTKKTAFTLAGISSDTFARWRNDDEQFALECQQAEEEAVARHVGIVYSAANKTWQAAAWWLERRRPEDFKLRSETEHAGGFTVHVEFETPEDHVAGDALGPSEG